MSPSLVPCISDLSLRSRSDSTSAGPKGLQLEDHSRSSSIERLPRVSYGTLVHQNVVAQWGVKRGYTNGLHTEEEESVTVALLQNELGLSDEEERTRWYLDSGIPDLEYC